MSINTKINFNLVAGESIGIQPLYQWNAKVTGSLIQLYNSKGQALPNNYTSLGDCITILSISSETNLALIQFPYNDKNCYVQGYIKVSDFNLLKLRFYNSWINSVNNQEVLLINGDLSSNTLSLNETSTYLYSTDTYACIIYKDFDNKLQIGYVPLCSGNLNVIQTNIPYYLASGTSVGKNPTYPTNAINFLGNINIVDINNISIPNTYTSLGDEITILEIYPDEKVVLIEFPDSFNNTYIIGYIPLDNLTNNSIIIRNNHTTFNTNCNYRALFNINKTQIYSIESTESFNYLFQTGNYACILFNNTNLPNNPIETAFISLDYGTFDFNSFNTSSIPLIEQTALYIACNEGFSSSPYYYGTGIYGNSIGYGSYYTKINFPNTPISKTYAFEYLINYLKQNIPVWNDTISKYLKLDTLTDYQKVALYDFAYNIPAYLGDISCKLASNPSWSNTFANFLIPKEIYTRRLREWLTFTKNNYFMGGTISNLPSTSYISLANSMNYLT